MATVAQKKHLDRVAGLGCILCRHLGYGYSPATIHHLREGQGMAQRASHYLAVPLCPEHHTGDSGFHGLGMRMFKTRYKLEELDLLDMTYELLMEVYAP